jgi:hypothetical protein
MPARKLLARLRQAVGSWRVPPEHTAVPNAALFDWQRGEPGVEPVVDTAMPAVVAERLRPDDPALQDLRERYGRCDARATTPLLWEPGTVGAADLAAFRGETAYVWQRRGALRSVNAYALAAYYLFSPAGAGGSRVAERFAEQAEDGLFGAAVYEIAGRRVSRDLLDSLAELDCIDRQLGLGAGGITSILDIGAGYGRLAHRALSAFPELARFVCTDAVAESTYLCGLYLAYRDVGERALVAPLDRIDAVLAETPVQLAVNIHSFSECRPEAIGWWLGLLARHRVPWLLVAPNALDHGGRELLTNDRRPFAPLIEQAGYRKRSVLPKYADPVVQRYGLSPTMYHFFEYAT